MDDEVSEASEDEEASGVKLNIFTI